MPVTWQTLLRAMRAPLGVLVFAMAALLVPPQTKDMLAALQGDRWLAFSPELWSQAIRFEGALALLSMNAWFWSKALVDADFLTRPGELPYGKNELRALNDVPLALAILAAVVWAFVVVFHGLVNLIVGVGYVGIIIWLSRRSWFGQRSRNNLIKRARGHFTTGGFVWHRVELLFDRVPGPHWLAVALLGLSLACFLVGSVATFLAPGLASHLRLSAWIAWLFPGPGAALVCLALIIPPLSLMTFIADGWPLATTLRGMSAWIVTILVFFLVWWACSDPLGWGTGFVIAAVPGLAVWRFRARIRNGMRWLIQKLLSVPQQNAILALGDMPFGPQRAPILLLAIAVLITAQAFCYIHTVRVVEDGPAKPMLPSQRADLEDVFKSWVAACSPGTEPVRPVIVAISGGASRAAVWGASVLTAVENASVDNKGAAIFAVSSVSGGSLGAAAYMSLMGSLKPEQLCVNGGTTADRRRRAAALDKAPLGHDALGPLLAGAIVLDVPRTLFSSVAAAARYFTGQQPRGGDRAAAIEHGFEDLWEDWPAKDRPSPAPAEFSQPFLSLFYDESHKPRPGMPVWIANGTDSTSGSRLLTISFAAKEWPFPGALDVLAVLGADVPISTAINNTARFPYLEPGGQLLPTPAAQKPPTTKSEAPRLVEVIDGGYFENEGLQTSLDLANWLREEGRKLAPPRRIEPIIVQATADGETVPPDSIARCGMPIEPETPGTVARSSSPAAMFAKLFDGMSGEFLTPLFGLYSVRGGHSAVLLQQAAAACRKADRAAWNFFHFYLPGPSQNADVPLNWILSRDTVDFIRGSIENDAGNKAELGNLQKALE